VRLMFTARLCTCVFALLLYFPVMVMAGVPEVSIGRFETDLTGLPHPWQMIQLEKNVSPTQYRTLYWDGVHAVESQANRSMALLARKVDVDLTATPVLCWRWRTEDVLKQADMKRRQGDDYAARVYIAFALPSTALSFTDKAALSVARAIFGDRVPDAAINYVWDNRHSVDTRLPNAYTDRAQMIVRRTGSTDIGRWVTERVDVRDDVIRAFGSDKAKPILVAIASDTDNTGEKVRAGFADLHFVGKNDACNF
jgi:Protein of unknown function (DUF3047)